MLFRSGCVPYERPQYANFLDVEFQIQQTHENVRWIFYPTYPFRDPSVLQHLGHLSHEDVCAMNAADVSFDKDDVSVPQYDLRSHAAPVHDAPSTADHQSH